jgi:hypothetical protein
LKFKYNIKIEMHITDKLRANQQQKIKVKIFTEYIFKYKMYFFIYI